MTAIVDCNSFYCSCERLFRPDLDKSPVVVLSNNDGCIISRSDEAKQLGVEMAGPYFKARPMIEKHGVAVFSSNYQLYGDLSWRVMETMRTMLGRQQVEVYSVDEAFLNLDMVPAEQLAARALEIRETVETWTGIKVSVGVAPTKVLAKMANRLAKKNKLASNCVMLLDSKERIKAALQQTPVDEIWGVGRQYAQKLKDAWGIFDAWQLSQMSEAFGKAQLGGVVGARLIRELNGEASRFFEEELVVKKVIATTRMFGRAVSNINDIKEAVATYTSRAAEKLRRQRSAAGQLSVFMVSKDDQPSDTYRRGTTVSSYVELPVATCLSHELIKAATQLVDQLYEPGLQYKKAGVTLSALVPDASIQGNLFEGPGEGARRKLMDMVDNINFSQRDDVLKFAASGLQRNWKMRQDLRSARYTTRWDELCQVK